MSGSQVHFGKSGSESNMLWGRASRRATLSSTQSKKPFFRRSSALAALHGYDLGRVGVGLGQDAETDALRTVPFIRGGGSCGPLCLSPLDQRVQSGRVQVDCCSTTPQDSPKGSSSLTLGPILTNHSRMESLSFFPPYSI